MRICDNEHIACESNVKSGELNQNTGKLLLQFTVLNRNATAKKTECQNQKNWNKFE